MVTIPKFLRKIVTAPLSRKDAEALYGSVKVDGKLLTVEEIMADETLAKVTHSRNTDTGEMQKADEESNHSGVPIFVIKGRVRD